MARQPISVNAPGIPARDVRSNNGTGVDDPSIIYCRPFFPATMIHANNNVLTIAESEAESCSVGACCGDAACSRDRNCTVSVRLLTFQGYSDLIVYRPT